MKLETIRDTFEGVFFYPSIEGFLKIHKAVLPGDSNEPKALKGITASIYYVDTKTLKICHIVRAIIKNHYFIDGNKRTGLLAYYSVLCDLNGLPKRKNIARALETIAANELPLHKIEEMLFVAGSEANKIKVHSEEDSSEEDDAYEPLFD